MPRWRLLNHWMQEKRPLERNDTVLCVYNNFIIHHTSLGKWQKGKQLVIVLICGNFVVLVNIIRCIFAIAHAGKSSRHNEMSKPVFWLHNLEWRYITLSLHTFDWGQTMHFSWVSHLSLTSVIDFSCFIDLQVVYWGDPVIGFRCWLKSLFCRFHFSTQKCH